MKDTSTRVWIEGRAGVHWVHFKEPVWRGKGVWVSSYMKYITSKAWDSLKTQSLELGILDWLPQGDECVEIIITPKNDGVLCLGHICPGAAEFLKVRPVGAKCDAEYICTWLPA